MWKIMRNTIQPTYFLSIYNLLYPMHTDTTILALRMYLYTQANINTPIHVSTNLTYIYTDICTYTYIHTYRHTHKCSHFLQHTQHGSAFSISSRENAYCLLTPNLKQTITKFLPRSNLKQISKQKNLELLEKLYKLQRSRDL